MSSPLPCQRPCGGHATMFDLAVDSQLRGGDGVKIKIGDVVSGGTSGRLALSCGTKRPSVAQSAMGVLSLGLASSSRRGRGGLNGITAGLVIQWLPRLRRVSLPGAGGEHFPQLAGNGMQEGIGGALIDALDSPADRQCSCHGRKGKQCKIPFAISIFRVQGILQHRGETPEACAKGTPGFF
jgi:hypothetical protein